MKTIYTDDASFDVSDDVYKKAEDAHRIQLITSGIVSTGGQPKAYYSGTKAEFLAEFMGSTHPGVVGQPDLPATPIPPPHEYETQPVLTNSQLSAIISDTHQMICDLWEMEMTKRTPGRPVTRKRI